MIRSGRIGILAVAAAALLVFAAGAGTALAKKKGSQNKPFGVTKLVNLQVQDAVLMTRSTPLLSTITVGKKYKGRTVGDLNVTGIQTTGSDAGAANDLFASLTAPNGRTVSLFSGVGDKSLGPWTIDDDTSIAICNVSTPPCRDATQSLDRPFAGTSNTIFNIQGAFPSSGPLMSFDRVPMKGVWTFTVFDQVTGASNGTSILNQWGLQITPQKKAEN